MRLAANFAHWRQAVEFYLVEDRDDNGRPVPYLLQPGGDAMNWERQQEGFCWSRPSFQMSEQRSQELFETLWASGFRPRSAVNEASRIEAVTRHLEDLRAIAFDRLKVERP